MFHTRLKQLRIQKGFSQVELATRLHVVRQTISKWEKGLSVPDAEIVTKLAQELDVTVSQLLGADMKLENGNNAIAEQLARINEQLARRNRRARRIWICAGLLVVLLLCSALLIWFYPIIKILLLN